MLTHVITLPETFDATALSAIEAEVVAANNDGDCKIVLFQGDDSVFCRGMNFNFLYENAKLKNFVAIGGYKQLALKIYHCPKITLAKIAGDAIGGGLGIAALCDYVVTSNEAKFALPEALFGIIPGVVIPILNLRCRSIDIKKMALRTSSITASKAKALNLVDEVVDNSLLDKTIQRREKEFSRSYQDSVAAIKKMYHFRHDPLFVEEIELGASLLEARLCDETALNKLKNYYDYGIVDWE